MEEVNLEFRKLTLDCMESLRPFFAKNQCRICDCTIGGTFIWRDYHNTEYAVEDGVLYLKVSYPETAFTPPRGEKACKSSYERIIAHCRANEMLPRLRSVSETVLESIIEMYPKSEYRTDRAWSDYLYLSDDLKNLAGRRYAGQRNHINRFLKENPEWKFERVTAENIGAVRAYVEKSASEYAGESKVNIEGNKKALEVLDNIERYGQSGGALIVAGEIVGVSLGETMDDTLFVHVEKADVAHHGSYPMLMNQFARTFAADGVAYINREEDDGVEGLRTSKMSYHPVELLEKYVVTLI